MNTRWPDHVDLAYRVLAAYLLGVATGALLVGLFVCPQRAEPRCVRGKSAQMCWCGQMYFASLVVMSAVVVSGIVYAVFMSAWCWWSERHIWLKQYERRVAADARVAELEEQVAALLKGPYRR